MSDVWQDHYDNYKQQYGDHPALIEEMLKNERFVLPASAGFYALYALRHTPGNGERIDKALHAIEEANLGKLRDVFQDISFNSNKLGDEQQKNDILRHLLEDFAKPELNLRESRVGQLDVIGNAYEFLIKNFASTSGKKAGEFYTPPEVSTLMARLMDPQPGDEICDPTCGSGSLLMKCGRLIRQRTGARKYALYGQEAIGSTWALAKMNMFLHGEDNHRIEWGDTSATPSCWTVRPASSTSISSWPTRPSAWRSGASKGPRPTSSAASVAAPRRAPRATTPSSCTWSRP